MIALDLMLPGLVGAEAGRRVRSFSDADIMMLTAQDEELDKLVGLFVRADDHLDKAAEPGELVP